MIDIPSILQQNPSLEPFVSPRSNPHTVPTPCHH
jgi:hypothetical protein